MSRFFHRNIALVLAPVMTVLAIALYNMTSLLVRHHHTALHDLRHAIVAVLLFGSFYALIRYVQELPDEDD